MTCSLCADKAYIVEDEVKTIMEERNSIMMQPNLNEREMECCSWCADEDQQEEPLFLCDDCPRVFCANCVKKSHGDQGNEMIQALMENEDRWSCPACAPTPLIERLRRLFLELDIEGKKGDKLNEDNISSSEDDDGEHQVQKLVDKLSFLEDELEEIAERLESKNLDQLRKEIQKELQSSEEVEEEIKIFIELNLDRHSNVSDAIGIIHDELGRFIFLVYSHSTYVCILSSPFCVSFILKIEAKDIDLTKFYKSRIIRSAVDNDVDTEWKIEADRELDKRDEAENMQKGYVKGADGYKGHDALYRDFEDLDPSERKVDELCTTEEAIEMLESIAKKKGDASVVRNFRDKALRSDDWDLEELCVRAVHHSDIGDKIKDRKSSVTGMKMSSRNTLIVSRNRYPLNQKKKTSRHHLKNEKRPKTLSPAKVIESREPSKKRKIVPLFLSCAKRKQEKPDEYGSESKTFDDSNCILGTLGDKKISIASSLAAKLKSHQIEGCKFMWDQVFGDISNPSQCYETKQNDSVKTGCILAHNMGL